MTKDRPRPRSVRTSSIDIKRNNRNRVYRHIFRNRGISRPELVQRLGMSIPTVMQNVKSLFEQGLVREDGNLESTGGRKAVALSCVEDARLAVGVEITRDHIGLVLIDLDGNVLAKDAVGVHFRPDGDYARDVADAVERLIGDWGAEGERVLGVGVSLPGILSADGTLFNTTVLPALNYRTGILADAIGRPCQFVNDANAAGIAEKWGREGDGDFVYLSLSNSVGGAIVWDGALRTGDTERGGEFGHITLDRNGIYCYCGRRGCLDAYVNARLLSSRADGSLDAFFAGVEKGEGELAAFWDAYLGYLATAVNILRMAFDCDVVIGGYVGAYIGAYLDELRRRVAGLNTFVPDGAYVKACRRRTEASAVGAALVHIERFIHSV